MLTWIAAKIEQRWWQISAVVAGKIFKAALPPALTAWVNAWIAASVSPLLESKHTDDVLLPNYWAYNDHRVKETVFAIAM